MVGTVTESQCPCVPPYFSHPGCQFGVIRRSCSQWTVGRHDGYHSQTSALKQRSANTFCKGPGSKYARLCSPLSVIDNK